MKKILLYIVFIVLVVGGNAYDKNQKRKILNEVINEKENASVKLYYNEFNQNYLIEIDGEVYEVQDEIIINEFEDIEEHQDIKDFIIY